jgi:hypothetical protein
VATKPDAVTRFCHAARSLVSFFTKSAGCLAGTPYPRLCIVEIYLGRSISELEAKGMLAVSVTPDDARSITLTLAAECEEWR